MSPLKKSCAADPVGGALGKPLPTDLDQSHPATERNGETEDWIFGDDPRAMQGFLRSLDDARRAKIADNGFGIRVYPASAHRALGYIVDAERNTCSGDTCRSVDTPCAHVWEDRFRFGMYAGRLFVPPAHCVKIQDTKSGAYAGVTRHRARPNPDIDGKCFATRMKHARNAIPIAYKRHLRDAFAIVRKADTKKLPPRGRGRPAADRLDIAYAAVVRIAESLPYDELNAKIGELFEAGFISSRFKSARVVEAMNDPALGVLLDRIINKLIRPFRKVSTTLVLDGMVFSTARTDNSRRNRYTSEGPVQLTLHALYEIRWGFLVAYRLTWNQRGRGSGESPQLPYLLTKAREVLDYENLLADTAFYSRRNLEFAETQGFNLVTKAKRSSKKAVDSPLLLQTFPFRNRVEGWHDVLRETTRPYLISRPDRSKYPKQTQKELRIAAMMKDQPEIAEADLPDDQEERERIIMTEQFVGVSPNNEMRCRQVNSLVRALVKAEEYYGDKVNLTADRAFEPRVEDEEFSIYRPLRQSA